MFNSELGKQLVINREYKTIQDLIFQSVNRVDIEARTQQYENIILSGGSSMYKNINTRLEAEVSKKLDQNNQKNVKVKVLAQKDRK